MLGSGQVGEVGVDQDGGWYDEQYKSECVDENEFV